MPTGLNSLDMKKVISTSLFGKTPTAYDRYARFAPISANFVKENMPGWNFRLYYDDTVNKAILKTLEQNPIVELVNMQQSIGRSGCFWRFLAFDDCDIAICRDLDWKMQQNDIEVINLWEKSDSLVHFLWVAQPRKLTKTKRYYMAGCVGARKLPFNVQDLINTYPDDKSVFGADEWFLGNYFVPKVLQYQQKIPLYIEPQPKLIPVGKTKEYIELFPHIEEYIYLTNNYKDI